MPLNRLSRRTMTLGLLAAPALLVRGAPIGAQDATPEAGEDRYVSEQFGYEIVWAAPWTLVTSGSEAGGYDMVQLEQGEITAYIVISRPGDTPLSEIVEFMIDGPDTEETFVPGMTETDTDGAPIEGETEDRAWVAYAGNLAGEDVDGFTEFRYGEVWLLEDDLGVGLSIAMPAGEFDGDVAPFSALLDGVTKLGALRLRGSAKAFLVDWVPQVAIAGNARFTRVIRVGEKATTGGCPYPWGIDRHARSGFRARWVIGLRPIAGHRSLRYDRGDRRAQVPALRPTSVVRCPHLSGNCPSSPCRPSGAGGSGRGRGRSRRSCRRRPAG